MTAAEARRIIHPDTTLEALAEIEYYSGFDGKAAKIAAVDEACWVDDMTDEIIDVPAANVAPVVHGRWEWFDEDTGTPITGYEREWGWRCSYCGYELSDDYDDPDYHPRFNYCPNCGAKMDEEGIK